MGTVIKEVVTISKANVFIVSFERIIAKGHKNIQGLHPTTIEITKEKTLTPRGDCIIGIMADKAVNDLSPEFKKLLKDRNTVLIGQFYVNNKLYDTVIGQGDPSLILTNDKKMIFRKSTYVDDSTISIRTNKAARDLNRDMIKLLKKPETILTTILIALKPLEINPKNICIGRIIKYSPIPNK